MAAIRSPGVPWVMISCSVLMLVSTCSATVRNWAGSRPRPVVAAWAQTPDRQSACCSTNLVTAAVGVVVLDLRLPDLQLHDVAHLVRLDDGEGVAAQRAGEHRRPTSSRTRR